MKRKQPPALNLAIRLSNDSEPNGQDFDLVGDRAWLAITPPTELNLENRTVDLRISRDNEGFRIEIYYFDDLLGADTVIDSVSYSWEEMEHTWQATISESETTP